MKIKEIVDNEGNIIYEYKTEKSQQIISTEVCKTISQILKEGVDGAGGYKYVMWDTSGNNISDGKFYSTTDSFGGFFGGTKFIYGTGDEDFFYGTENKNGITNTFVFE